MASSILRGWYFSVPEYVNIEKPPGFSALPEISFEEYLLGIPSMFISSPKLLWAIIAMIFYCRCPYNLDKSFIANQSPLNIPFFISRFPLWLFVTILYIAFWHCTLYLLSVSNRPFIENRKYNTEKVTHNIFWSISGVAIWTCFENCFVYLWSSGKLPYKEFEFTPIGILQFIAILYIGPVYRDFHFYTSHRVMHLIRPLYEHAHSLHHRNTDIEPFSGLCMHPIEHLYYFSAVAMPCLLFVCSPFAVLWHGVHLLISPAASHSGWEDCFQSDVYHYMHHRYFECNHGSYHSMFLDNMFGTAELNMEKREKNAPLSIRQDSKSTLLLMPTTKFVLYLLLCFGCFAVWGYIANNHTHVSHWFAGMISLLPSYGPIVIAIYMSNKGKSESKKSYSSGDLFHIFIGNFFCTLPIAWICYLCL